MSRRDVALIAALYLAWLAIAYALNIAATGARSPQAVFDAWVRFDGIYFRALAEYGYAEASARIRPEIGFPFLTAFFPLFPLLIHLSAPLFAHNYSLASVVVPQTLTFLSLLLLFRLVTRDCSRTAAWFTLLSVATFPTAYFLIAGYSEALFLLLVLAAFTLYRHEQILGASVIGALAAATRITGAPLLLGAFALDLLNQLRLSRATPRRAPYALQLLALAIIPLGLAAYALYQWWALGDPLLFLQGHSSAEWSVGFDPTGPLKGLLLPLATPLKHTWTSEQFRTNYFNALFFYGALALWVYGWRRLPLVYSLYALLAIVVPTLIGSLISTPRYVLVAFPLFISMGLLFERHARARLLLAPLGLASVLATYLFFRTVFLG